MFKRILALVDAKSPDDDVMAAAAELARANSALLRIVDVVPEVKWPLSLIGGQGEEVVAQLRNSKAEHLTTMSERYSSEDLRIETAVLEGSSSVELIRDVVRGNFDLLIAPTKGSQSRRSGFFGTTGLRLLRKCPCPTLLLQPGRRHVGDRFVAAVDASPNDEAHGKLNKRILGLANSVMEENDQLHVLHVWSIYGESILLEHMRESEFGELEERTERENREHLENLVAEANLPENTKCVSIRGEPQDRIPEYVRENQADVLIMGTIARTGLAGLLIGNTAEQVLQRADCSVLTIKPEGFVTPIHVD